MEDMSKSLPDNYEISDYKITKVIGQGGFGITYLAVDKNLMQEVAIKEYYPREFSNRDSTFTIHAVGKQEDKDTFIWGLERFLEESRILAKLNHPNVVSVKRYFKANGTAYLVMEYCDGKPLDEIIKDHGPLKQEEINVIVSSLLSGLEHVHQNNFLHRDIKPANIFIRKNGQPVLLDFGAAKQDMSSHSKSVTSLATAGYAPFEQYSTNGKQGPWSDIYGLCATLYRAITGVKPQDAPDRMLEDKLAPVSKIMAGKFSPNLLAAIDKGMSIRPSDRPQTVQELKSIINPGKEPVAGNSKKVIELNAVKNDANTVPYRNYAIYSVLLVALVYIIYMNIPVNNSSNAISSAANPPALELLENKSGIDTTSVITSKEVSKGTDNKIGFEKPGNRNVDSYSKPVDTRTYKKPEAVINPDLNKTPNQASTKQENVDAPDLNKMALDAIGKK